MVSLSLRRGLSASIVALALCASAVGAGAQSQGDWAERVQIVYDADTRSVERVRLRVWDGEPHRNLEFVWEPALDATFDPAATGGIVEGRGKLIWRIRGSAAHDRRAIYSTYSGQMKDGRPHGQGRRDRRDGEIFEGEWVGGLLHGQGVHRDAMGNRYEGAFERGRPHGHGRQAMADGSIYEGSFRDGLRDGEGRLRLAGGTEYSARFRAGVEVEGNRPDALADATVGGLLRAQAGGGDAGKVELSLTVEPRMTQEATLRYMHSVQDERVEIYPENPGMVETWIGEAVARAYGYDDIFGKVDWSNAPAFLEVRFGTADGSRVRLAALELEVEDSLVYRKPFLSIIEHEGCIGYRPAFSFQNYGWGPAQDAKLTFEFFNLDDAGSASRSFTLDAGSFDIGTDLSLDAALAQAGVDTAALADARFTCRSLDDLPQCRQQAMSMVDFGELGDLVSGKLDLTLGVRGHIAYNWADDRGNLFEQNEPFETAIQVGFIETEMMVAEYGEGVGDAPEALRYQEVRLPADAQNYVIDMPVRGNKNLSSYVGLLKMFAEQTSIHRFRAVARFADGSERHSKPAVLFYVKPREEYREIAEPDACYIEPGYLGRNIE